MTGAIVGSAEGAEIGAKDGEDDDAFFFLATLTFDLPFGELFASTTVINSIFARRIKNYIFGKF